MIVSAHFQSWDYTQLFPDMHGADNEARLSDIKLILVDEAKFTFSKLESSNKQYSILVNDAIIPNKTIVFLRSISDGGRFKA